MDLNSAERIQEYSDIQSERYQMDVHSDITFKDIFKVTISLVRGKKVSKQEMKDISRTVIDRHSENELSNWPPRGNVVFDHLVLQYQSSPKPVLRLAEF